MHALSPRRRPRRRDRSPAPRLIQKESPMTQHDGKVPSLTLNNGVTLPAVGFGVFQTPPDETIAAVAAALRTGYRHIDTAAAYGNEREVGKAIEAAGLDRDDV